MRRGPVAEIEDAVEIDRKRLPPLTVAHRGEGLRKIDPRRRHEEVDFAEARGGEADQRLGVVGPRNIHRPRRDAGFATGQRGGEAVERRPVAVGKHEIGSGLRENFGHRAADAAIGAGQDERAAGEVEHHFAA